MRTYMTIFRPSSEPSHEQYPLVLQDDSNEFLQRYVCVFLRIQSLVIPVIIGPGRTVLTQMSPYRVDVKWTSSNHEEPLSMQNNSVYLHPQKQQGFQQERCVHYPSCANLQVDKFALQVKTFRLLNDSNPQLRGNQAFLFRDPSTK